jgi:hypothetical protein
LDANLGTIVSSTIPTLDANIGSYQTFANTYTSILDANLGTIVSSTIPTLNANIGTIVSSTIPNLDANIGTIVSSTIPTLDANIGTIVSSTIPTLDANLGGLSNIGTQSFTTNNAFNWNGTISTIQDALDELAARLRALGG